MENYFRITGYNEKDNYCFIVDSNGMFEKLWQFSAFLVQKGLKIIEVSKLENVIDTNIKKAEKDSEHIILRAISPGKPEYVEQQIIGTTYKALKVENKF